MKPVLRANGDGSPRSRLQNVVGYECEKDETDETDEPEQPFDALAQPIHNRTPRNVNELQKTRSVRMGELGAVIGG